LEIGGGENALKLSEKVVPKPAGPMERALGHWRGLLMDRNLGSAKTRWGVDLKGRYQVGGVWGGGGGWGGGGWGVVGGGGGGGGVG